MSTARSAACSASRRECQGGCTLGGIAGGEMAAGDVVCWSGITFVNMAAGVWSGAVRGLAADYAVSGTLGGGLVTMGKLRLENLRWVDCCIVWFFLCRADRYCSSLSSIRFW